MVNNWCLKFFTGGFSSAFIMKALPSSPELLRLIFKAKGCKRIAADMKVSRSLVEKWARTRGDGRSFELSPLDRMLTLLVVTGDVRLVQWLCAQAGGYFVANPPVKSWRTANLLPVESRVMAENLQLLAALAKTLGHRVSRSETRSLRMQWEQCKADMEGLVASCEWGMIRQHLGAWLLKFYPVWDALTPGGLI